MDFVNLFVPKLLLLKFSLNYLFPHNNYSLAGQTTSPRLVRSEVLNVIKVAKQGEATGPDSNSGAANVPLECPSLYIILCIALWRGDLNP